MTEDLSIELRGTNRPPGQIDVPDLLGVAGAVQLLMLRLGREQVRQTVGRTSDAVEAATRLRLHEVRRGSTGLDLVVGEAADEATDTLDLLPELPGEALVRVLDLFAGVATDSVPDWVTPVISDSVVSVIDALRLAAEECMIHSPSRGTPPVVFQPKSVRRSIWQDVANEPTVQEGVQVSGVLEAVDLGKRQRFRLRDDVGNAIELVKITNVDEAKKLIDTLVTASGTAHLHADGRIYRVRDAEVVDVVMPTWTDVQRSDFHDLADVHGGPEPEPVEGLSDAEVDDFLAAIRS